MTTLTEDTPVTKAEIEHAILEHRHTLARMPTHWIDRRASIHHAIDNLLDQWELAEA